MICVLVVDPGDSDVGRICSDKISVINNRYPVSLVNTVAERMLSVGGIKSDNTTVVDPNGYRIHCDVLQRSDELV